MNSNTIADNKTVLVGSNDDNSTERLNDDCLMIIFKHLDLPDLMNMAQVNAELYYIALYEFKRKYSQSFLAVGILMNPPRSFMENLLESTGKMLHLTNEERLQRTFSKFTFDTVAQRVIFNDYPFLINTIKYFGCLIKRVDMKENMLEANVVKPIFEHLNKYSARSLIQLKVGRMKIEWLNELKGPFPKLDEFSFSDSHERSFEFNPKRLTISEKFPNLRRLLFVNWIRESDTVFPDEYFPKLEYLKIQWVVILKENNTVRPLVFFLCHKNRTMTVI